MRAVAIVAACLAAAAHGLSSLPNFDGHYIYCWRTSESVKLTSISSAMKEETAEALNCGLEMSFSAPETLAVGEGLPVTWSVSYNPKTILANTIGLKVPFPVMQSPASRDVYEIYHSNIHSCEYGDNICDAYDNGVYVRDHTPNKLANFSANYSATYSTNELTFPRAGKFIVFAHIALPGANASERFDFAVYRTITVA
ncbi:hypothetical protein SDRG_05846 [Saprolegnia diclina VS20]|uniref:MD-2-related lipid-recognition domain-containing protein n=1 Tax=Saprolegnia diclina (strain VS20) TaxID=1156394 RepID=T0S2Z7_SAPDV|nr:hypothetical protein SDRG_05846 [Saprolegnia diclina VS20]EQC37027.1 hypothetical protein SDRG_05846 [Saprolegnia diclina VS20]|eukprot:XP_008609808.1 hypothetical protein SDRG_05846 [Saprolegnia diclina VS20]